MEAYWALEGPVPSMNAKMHIQVPSLCEEFETNVALEVLDIAMSGDNMFLDIFLTSERLEADGTLVLL